MREKSMITQEMFVKIMNALRCGKGGKKAGIDVKFYSWCKTHFRITDNAGAANLCLCSTKSTVRIAVFENYFEVWSKTMSVMFYLWNIVSDSERSTLKNWSRRKGQDASQSVSSLLLDPIKNYRCVSPYLRLMSDASITQVSCHSHSDHFAWVYDSSPNRSYRHADTTWWRIQMDSALSGSLYKIFSGFCAAQQGGPLCCRESNENLLSIWVVQNTSVW